jgi:glutamate synthase (NADPH/NADH) small chain
MGKVTGFLELERETAGKKPAAERVQNYAEYQLPLPEAKLKQQGARCMDCGVPFCHTGCPLGNLIPDFNDLVYRGHWRLAAQRLHSTNNFPEFTGRLCPAPCEEACVLGINADPVAIEEIEKNIVERAFAEGWIVPEQPAVRTGRKVAVIGSGPSGLAAAQQLNRAGHWVTVFERSDRIGGLLRYGIPDFKMEKWLIDRRVNILQQEGIVFQTKVSIGTDITRSQLDEAFDAVVFCGGSTIARDLPAPGRGESGVVQAMHYLPQQNRRVAGDTEAGIADPVLATGKHVIVIGGGDTGSDCIGTAMRQGAASVVNFELLPMPSLQRPANQPWPYWPMKLRTTTSHEEAGNRREFSILTKSFEAENGALKALHTVEVELVRDPLSNTLSTKEIAGTEKIWPCDLAILALGFIGPETDSVVAQYGCELDARGNVKTVNFMSSTPGFFSAGDAQRGQSLIVWAISDGRECACAVDHWLMGSSSLPTKGGTDLPRI